MRKHRDAGLNNPTNEDDEGANGHGHGDGDDNDDDNRHIMKTIAFKPQPIGLSRLYYNSFRKEKLSNHI
jgi:hypothetical protein